jgi:tRNA-splicing ligase RtcB (3'-phosphate/5'-hydroxy nucleic acid ligase)
MGDEAVIIEGVDSDRAREALSSTVHGAGRIIISRTGDRGRFVTATTNKRQRQPDLVRTTT